MGSPSSARHRCRQACSHPITAPAITLTASQRGQHATEHTKRSRCPLLDIGSPWRGRTLHTPHPLPHRPVPRARVSLPPFSFGQDQHTADRGVISHRHHSHVHAKSVCVGGRARVSSSGSVRSPK